MPSKRSYWPPQSKHIHVMGEIRRVKHGTGSISALYLYEKSVKRGFLPKELPKCRVEAMIGATNGIVCTICGDRIDWGEPPSEAYLRLMSHYPRVKIET